MPPEKTFFLLAKMLYFKYIQSKLQYTTSQSLLAILPTCEKVLKYFLQGFAGTSHSFG